MSTDDQIAANQQNSQLSTGPQTPEGKEVSKMNALKHGLLSKEVLLEGESEELLIDFGKRIRDELKPIGELELLLIDKIITYSWRLRRVISVQKAMMEWEREDELVSMFPLNEKPNKQKGRRAIRSMIVNEDTEKLTRYEASVVRNFYKALHELTRIQAVRRGENPPVPLAVDIVMDKGE